MSIHFYRDENGCVGDPREDDSDDVDREAADIAAGDALTEAQRLVDLLDREAGDNGNDAPALRDIARRIFAISDDLRALLGAPR